MSSLENKIFGIGLNKTGTRSLAVAMRHLGYRTLHKGGRGTNLLVEDALTSNVPLLSNIGDSYDCYLDVDCLAKNFVLLDEQYGGSKFILTTTDVERWLDSRERHVLGNQERAKDGLYDGPWLEVDRTAWVRERDLHHKAVFEYFSQRPKDLLVIDIPEGEGWEKLAPFLGRRAPSRSFPWENSRGLGTYRQESWQPRLRRRLGYAYGRLRRISDRPT